MRQLGDTRTSYQRDHALLTPDSFVRAPRPGMNLATAIVHAAPTTGAAFTQYTAEFEAGGTLGATAAERFVYVLSNAILLEAGGRKHRLEQDSFVFLPQNLNHQITA
jgi:(S)-ureidoglycine aminohydrolase